MRAKPFVPSGAPDHSSRGEVSAPSQVQAAGMYDFAIKAPVANVQVGVALPAWNRNEGNVIAAQGRVTQAQAGIGQVLAEGLLDDARSGEADHRARLGEDGVAQHGVAGGHSSGSRIRQYGYIWKALHVEIGKGRRNLCHLHQTQRSFLHARAART